jgi:hypothetical protein
MGQISKKLPLKRTKIVLNKYEKCTLSAISSYSEDFVIHTGEQEIRPQEKLIVKS